MHWDDVRFFLAVVRAGTVKGAAHALKVDPSTVTRRLASLEEEVGRLFERSGTTYSPTERGRTMRSSAERIESELLALEQRFVTLDARTKPVRVSFPTLLSTYVAAIAREVRDERPDVLLSLEASDRRVNTETEEVDVVVRIDERPPENLVGRRVGALGVGVFGAESYLERHPYPVDDPRHGWIAWSLAYAEKPPMRFLRETFPGARAIMVGESGDAVLQSVRAGLGLGALPLVVGREASLTNLYALPLEVAPSVWVLSPNVEGEDERVRFVRSRLFGLEEFLA